MSNQVKCMKCGRTDREIVISTMCRECCHLLKIPYIDRISGERVGFNKAQDAAAPRPELKKRFPSIDESYFKAVHGPI